MKTRVVKMRWVIFWGALGLAIIVLISWPRADDRGPKIVEEARQRLRQQGFKTDLADFDLSKSPGIPTGEIILSQVNLRRSQPIFRPNLMEMAGTNSVVVVWNQSALRQQFPSRAYGTGEISWDEFRSALAAEADICEAVLSTPIAFHLNASDGERMLLRHLAPLRILAQTLDDRVMLSLHDNHRDIAFTNLLAATRLATAWDAEPVEVSQMVRFALVQYAFDATWQAMQTNWTDEQLVRLQTEWMPANFFTNLPETVAFQRAAALMMCEQMRVSFQKTSFTEFFRDVVHDPSVALPELRSRWNLGNYFQHDIFEDETNVLFFFRDRELEMRAAVQAPTWVQMRALPGVTNRTMFSSPYPSPVQSRLSLGRSAALLQRQVGGLPGRAAEAETERRILIIAIALERFRIRHGTYPQTLEALVPEYLKTIPLDFMDGKPLRYHLSDNGHFILYSVGLDCVDNGGKIPIRPGDEGFIPQMLRPGMSVPESDIVWPLPASKEEIAFLRQKQKREDERHDLNDRQRESTADWEQSPLRQSRVEKILATDWNAAGRMETYNGRRVVDIIANQKFPGTNQLSLTELLKPRQIITGDEPENLAFEIPVSYDAITNAGELVLWLDAEPDRAMGDSGAKIQELQRATNGDCILVWHTIFDPPGKHAVQAGLILSSGQGGNYFLKGPAIAVATSNYCQFSLDSATYDVEYGARFHARVPEANAVYTIECVTTNGEHLKTLTGKTDNGEFNLVWDLVDDHDHRLTGETFNTIVQVTLPDSGRSQTMRGP